MQKLSWRFRMLENWLWERELALPAGARRPVGLVALGATGLAAAFGLGSLLPGQHAVIVESAQPLAVSEAPGPRAADSVFLGFAPVVEPLPAVNQKLGPLHLARHNRPLAMPVPKESPATVDLSAAASFVVAQSAPLSEPRPAAGQPHRFEPASRESYWGSFVSSPAPMSHAVGAFVAPDVVSPNSALAPKRSAVDRKAPSDGSRPALVEEPSVASPRNATPSMRMAWSRRPAGANAAGTPSPPNPMAQSDEIARLPAALPSTQAFDRASANDRMPLGHGLGGDLTPAISGPEVLPIVTATTPAFTPRNDFPFVSNTPPGNGHVGQTPAAQRMPTIAALPVSLPPSLLSSEILSESAPPTLGRETSGELAWTLAPEPGTASLFALGLGGLALRRRRV